MGRKSLGQQHSSKKVLAMLKGSSPATVSCERDSKSGSNGASLALPVCSVIGWEQPGEVWPWHELGGSRGVGTSAVSQPCSSKQTLRKEF